MPKKICKIWKYSELEMHYLYTEFQNVSDDGNCAQKQKEVLNVHL